MSEPDPARADREQQQAGLARVELRPIVTDIARQHDETVVGVDQDGLVARRVAGSRQHSHAGEDLHLPVVLD